MSLRLSPPKSLQIRSAFSPKNTSTSLSFSGPGRTKQSFKDECDINKIMARFVRTGVMDFVSKYSPQYGDVTGLDFQRAMDTVANANSMFAALPASIRARFDNAPAKFLDFMEDPANEAKARELGLLPAVEDSGEAPPAPGAKAPSEPARTPPPA